jgi:hypothetical protein
MLGCTRPAAYREATSVSPAIVSAWVDGTPSRAGKAFRDFHRVLQAMAADAVARMLILPAKAA